MNKLKNKLNLSQNHEKAIAKANIALFMFYRIN